MTPEELQEIEKFNRNVDWLKTSGLKKQVAINKTWLTRPEAMAYMGLGRTKFIEIQNEDGFTMSRSGQVIWYKVKELNAAIEKRIFIKQAKIRLNHI